MCTARGGCSQSVAEDGPSLCDSCCWEQPTPGRSGCGSGGLMGVILQVALPSRVLAAARLQCGAAGAGASRGLGVCAEHARLAARGESARAMEIGDFLVGWCRGATRSVRAQPGDGNRRPCEALRGVAAAASPRANGALSTNRDTLYFLMLSCLSMMSKPPLRHIYVICGYAVGRSKGGGVHNPRTNS